VTVLSRCLQFNLKQIPHAQIQARLRRFCKRKDCVGAPALALLARAAQGSLRDALSLLDQAIAVWRCEGRARRDSRHAGRGGPDLLCMTILRALAHATAPA
jgi:replication-associated recombination protein RarA